MIDYDITQATEFQLPLDYARAGVQLMEARHVRRVITDERLRRRSDGQSANGDGAAGPRQRQRKNQAG